MTNFEDQLLSDLMTEHGAQLRQLPQPGSSPAGGTSRAGKRLRAVRRPAWLATGAAGLAAAATAAVMTLGGAAPAYAVSRGADGTVQVSVSQPSGVAGANAALHRLHVRVAIVPVRPGCRSISSLPHPRLVHHPAVSVSAGKPRGGQRSVTVKVSGKGIPAGATMLLAFSTHGGASLGAGGWITGPVPNCVSIPGGIPGGQGGSHSAG
ncbi:MAG TPA: hypothetical protein VGI74_10635 [Streptosporangiaceae bacterium]|jgi:hypothetical protein